MTRKTLPRHRDVGTPPSYGDTPLHSPTRMKGTPLVLTDGTPWFLGCASGVPFLSSPTRMECPFSFGPCVFTYLYGDTPFVLTCPPFCTHLRVSGPSFCTHLCVWGTRQVKHVYCHGKKVHDREVDQAAQVRDQCLFSARCTRNAEANQCLF